MRIVFMGTPAFAATVLDGLVEAGHEVVAAYTQPPRPGGRRGRELVASPVQRWAEALGIEVRSPARLRSEEEQAAFASMDADVGIVAAYGLILPQAVLDAPRHGCLNVHASLLPRWRGAAPIQRAILAGDAETGVCIMQMEAGLDTGPVLLDGRLPIAGKTAGRLTGELATMGAALMAETLIDLSHRLSTPQSDEGVTYAAKIDKAEVRLAFDRPAEEVERQVRAFAPTPGAWLDLAGERIKVLAATLAASPGGQPGTTLDDEFTIACRTGAIQPTLVQRAGRATVTAAELLRGFPIKAGTRLA